MDGAFHPFASIEACAQALAADMAETLSAAIAERGAAGLAVSGGRTPRHVLPLLAGQDVAWDKVAVTLTDERWVEADNADSNEKLVRDFLLTGAASAARFVSLKTPAADPGGAIDEVEARLDSLSWPIDAVFLGMGEDGHVASLFPGVAVNEQGTGRCVAAPAAVSRLARISLTARALLDSRRIFLALSGRAKRDTLERALRPGSVSELPLRMVLHQDRVPLGIYVVE